MDDGWMVGAAMSRLLIPESEISFLLLSLRLFHMRAPAPCCLHPRRRRRGPWSCRAVTFDRERAKHRIREEKICCPGFHPESQEALGMSGRASDEGGDMGMETGVR